MYDNKIFHFEEEINENVILITCTDDLYYLVMRK
jgi:hypothetical protein